MNPIPCEICKCGGHTITSCPELIGPLKDGFYSGKHEEGGHDEEKNSCNNNL